MHTLSVLSASPQASPGARGRFYDARATPARAATPTVGRQDEPKRRHAQHAANLTVTARERGVTYRRFAPVGAPRSPQQNRGRHGADGLAAEQASQPATGSPI